MFAYKTLTDPELTELLKLDDRAAHDEIYNRYWQLLYQNAANLIRNSDEAQDCVQDVFVSLWHRRKELNILSVKAYLIQAVRYRVLETIRNNKADQNFYSALAVKTGELITENPLIFKELSHLITDVIENLPEDCKTCFLMNREQGMTYKQIAAVLQISEKTVEKRMSKALKLIREGLTQYLPLFAIALQVLLSKK
ncbi:RNA polymerase sigma-70 factor [Pedobacter sp. MC2016-14]|uniref:RNA polymerase sigma factor n=1 Tax=Pedobacter sp. MC2016-14 TaxID=2897327 RepID=UPI001E3065B7|nr:RNA polymerase sigma-70 factor [Pedobacter sp. MC2016-14]MCD0490392.1 RNA polymerase sigma-70 factor [Pedobacter sp. MC2016-14]